ncbi:TonB-dependent siderophore receptor [Arcobacter sp. CECT 9188]|nr:TonB-dependent siderophore receptor [Arcobacter sp. CECT 9188]
MMISGTMLSAKEISLQEAVDSIVKEYKVSYISKSKSLKDRKVDDSKMSFGGVINSLNKVLEAEELKAVEEEGIIYIIDKPKPQNGFSKTTVIDTISVNESYKNGSAESGYLVEEISGVGIWNERKLQDTPYSMNVISSDLIENVQAKDMNQIFKMNPTTQVEDGNFGSTGGDHTGVTIRGFNSSNPIVDGISYAGSSTNSVMMQDIARVEIISGATGFLYGGGRVGGAVNYITKKPTTKDLRNITIGSYGNESYYTHLDLGGQFNEENTFGYRLNALYQDGRLPSEADTKQKAISLVFDWKPTDNFYTDIKYAYKDYLAKGGNLVFGDYGGVVRSDITSNKYSIPDWMDNESNTHNISNNIRWDINDIFTLRTNAMYEEHKGRGTYGYIHYYKNNIIEELDARQFAWNKTKNYGANIYLDSKFDTGSINHTLTTGYSLNSRKLFRSADNELRTNRYYNYTFSDYKNLSEPNWSDFGTIGTQSKKPITQTQYKNILIGDDIVFNEQWSALVGVNYATAINKNYLSNTKYDKSELTPTISLIYKPFENITTYATYIESLEAGTIVGIWYANEGNILDPYKSKQYEIGAKYSLFDEKALLTASLFRIEKANSYTDESTIASLGKPTLTQDGEQIHQGIEIGLTGKVTDNLTLMGGVTFMDLSLEKIEDKSLKGNKPTLVATKMAKLFVEYNIPYINGLAINTGAYYTGKSYVDQENKDVIPSYTIYDAGLRYSTKLGQYPTTFNLNVQNLTNKVYWANANGIGDTRSVAFSMKMEF